MSSPPPRDDSTGQYVEVESHAPKEKKTPRRRNSAVSISAIAESLLLANAGTQAAFNLSAWDFVSDGWGGNTKTSATDRNAISLYEMIYGHHTVKLPALPSGQVVGSTGTTTAGVSTAVPATNAELVMANLRANWLPAVTSMVAIPVAFRVGRRLLRKPISVGNKALKQAGLRSVIRI